MAYTQDDIRDLLDRQELAAGDCRRALADPRELDAEVDAATAELSVEERWVIGGFLEALLAVFGQGHL